MQTKCLPHDLSEFKVTSTICIYFFLHVCIFLRCFFNDITITIKLAPLNKFWGSPWSIVPSGASSSLCTCCSWSFHILIYLRNTGANLREILLEQFSTLVYLLFFVPFVNSTWLSISTRMFYIRDMRNVASYACENIL